MIVKEISLTTKQDVDVQGCCVDVQSLTIANATGRRSEFLELKREGSDILRLKHVIDNSQRIDDQRVFIVCSELVKNKVFIFGGEVVYGVDIFLMRVDKEFTLERDDRDVEYWVSDIFPQKNGVLIVYEAGVFYINEALELVWHKKKYYNDHVEIKDGAFSVVADDGGSLLYSIKDGSLID